MEKIKIKSAYTQAKIIGTLVTVAGALVMIMYQGPNVVFPWTKNSTSQTEAASQDGGDFIKGTLILFCACFTWSAFFILQVINHP